MLEINEENCIGCKICEKVCPFGAIIVDPEDNKARVLETCTLCGACVNACRYDAIAIKRKPVSKEDLEKYIKDLISSAKEQNQHPLKLGLQRLFPRFSNVSYSSDTLKRWDAQRRVCIEKHFDTYFRSAIGEETLPLKEINEFIERCGDIEFVKKSF